jgi:hypothetical protein
MTKTTIACFETRDGTADIDDLTRDISAGTHG